jgi:hypothetical protein
VARSGPTRPSMSEWSSQVVVPRSSTGPSIHSVPPPDTPVCTFPAKVSFSPGAKGSRAALTANGCAPRANDVDSADWAPAGGALAARPSVAARARDSQDRRMET